MLDEPVGGYLCSKQSKAAQSLIDEMATNGYQWSSERNKPAKAAGIYEIDVLTILVAQVKTINKRLDIMQMPSQAPVMSCES